MKFFRLTWCLVLSFAASVCLAQSNPVPFVNQPLMPMAGTPGAPEFPLTVNGAGFVSGSTVDWNGTPLATTFVSADKLTAVVPANNVSTAGTANVTVVSPTPGGGSSNPVPFTITKPTSKLVFGALPITGTVSPMGMVTADFNHDGIPDLAVIDQGPVSSCNSQDGTGGAIEIFLGNGNGTFTEHSNACFLDGGLGTQTLLGPIVAGDLTGDGNVDLVVAFYDDVQNGFVNTYHVDGDGTFATSSNSVKAALADSSGFTPFAYIQGLAMGDFYGNGQLNLAESAWDDFGFTYLFVGSEDILGMDPDPYGDAGPLSAGDFNGDGVLDLAMHDGSSLRVFSSPGSGSFISTQMPASSVPFGKTTSLVSGDFNGDGILDLAGVNGNSISVLLGNGDGTFAEKGGQPTSALANTDLIAADMNGDGILDLVVTDSTGADSIWLGNGDGTFQAPVATPGFGPVVAADFNGDGRMDLATTNSPAGTLTVLLQGLPNQTTPTITWPTPEPIAFGTPLSATQLNATASVAGSFFYSPTAGTVLSPGSHTLTAIFTPANTTAYTTAVASVTLIVFGSGGSLSGTVASSSSAVNLSAGTSSWAFFDGLDANASGSLLVSYLIGTGPIGQSYGNDPRPFSWTDGTPVSFSTNNTSGLYVAGIGNSFTVGVPASTIPLTVNVYVGGWISGGTLTAALTDNSAPVYTDSSLSSSTGQYDGVYTLTYAAASISQGLTINWIQTSGDGNVTLQAASIDAAPPTMSLVQHKVLGNNVVCNPTCPALTINPTGAGNLLFVSATGTGDGRGNQTNIAGISCSPSCGAWVLPGAACQLYTANTGGIDCAYVLSSAGGATSVTITMSGDTPYGAYYFREYHTTAPAGFSFDNVATTLNSNCMSCMTPALTLARPGNVLIEGPNDILIAGVAGGNDFSGVNPPYGDQDLDTYSDTGIADLLNASSSTGATFNEDSAGYGVLYTMAFTDSTIPCGEISQTGTRSENALVGWVTPCVTGDDANGYIVSSISYWVGSPVSTSFDFGIYASSSPGNPGSLLCSGFTEPFSPAPGWNTINIDGCPTLSPATTYWVGYITGSNSIQQGAVAGACPGTPSYNSAYTTGVQSGVSLPNPFGENVGANSCSSLYLRLVPE